MLGADVRIQIPAAGKDSFAHNLNSGEEGRRIHYSKLGSFFVMKFVRMLMADKEHCQLNGSTYIKIESVKMLYEILNVKVMSDLDIQTFFNLIKRSS